MTGRLKLLVSIAATSAKPRNVSGNPLKKLYYKRYFNEIRIEQDEVWGTCNYYFETLQNGEVLRQIEVYENDKELRYDNKHREDEYGFLTDQFLYLDEFENYSITETEFESKWQN